MRLHSLRVSAFGPFAGTETVDFDALAEDGLFLLHGETGAGKTTVLDAVAFALFGAVPGARNEARRLVSDHAAPGVRPEVELELTVAGRRMRLVRSPEYQRAKRRGSGTTKENARATLTWVGDPTAEGLTRLDEIGRTVSRLLGMSAEQFFQVVLLPQGEFARFLRADTDDRAVLLQKLFDTGRFNDVEKWFAEQRRVSAARLDQTKSELRLQLGKLATAAGVADPGIEEETSQWVAGLAIAAGERDRECTQELDSARVRAKAAAAGLTAAQGQSARLERKRRAQRELERLLADESSRATQAAELAAARRAHPVALAQAETDEAAAVAVGAAREAERLCIALQSDSDGADGLAGDLAGSVTGWRSQIGRLGELVALAQRTDVDAEELASVQMTLDRGTEALAEVTTRRISLPVALDGAEQALVRAQHAEESLGALAAAWQTAADVTQAADKLSGVGAELVAARAAAVVALDAHQDARQHWLDLRERRLDGMAAELAATLAAGDLCPVCGSAEHPRPALADEEHVSRAQELHAHETEGLAASARDRAVDVVHQLVRAVDTLTQRSGGAEAIAARAACTAAEAAHAEAELLAGTVSTVRDELSVLQNQQQELDLTERLLREELSTHTERCRSLNQRISQARERLAEACGADRDVHSRRVRLHELADAAGELLAARGAALTAARHAENRQRKAEDAATRAGFADVGAALAAVRAEDVIAKLDSVLAEARDAEISVRAVLAEPDIATTADLDVDLSGPEAACAEAEEVLAAAQGRAAEAARRRVEVTTLGTELGHLTARIRPEVAEDAELSALADVVNGRGQNSRRISLHSYVLAARLEEVAVVASVRLRRMSGGRFEFVHSDAPGARGTRGGLGLDIRDDYTGAVRPAKTLSGGESFLASLALALGLADVVSAESGGVPLDTLFIDEGFGTLDAGTLEEVMAVLDELRAGGRVVGLVSHVDELRQRIPNRLHVHKGRAGSHLEISSG